MGGGLQYSRPLLVGLQWTLLGALICIEAPLHGWWLAVQ